MRTILAWFGLLHEPRYVKLDLRSCHGRPMAYLMTADGEENGPLWTKEDAHQRVIFLWNEGEVSPLVVLDLLLTVQTSKLSDDPTENCDRMVSVTPSFRLTLDVFGRRAA